MTFEEFKAMQRPPCKLDKYIQPGEAEKLLKYQGLGEYLLSVRIYYEIFGSINVSPEIKECGGVFHAGYVAGIRAERDKRRRNAAAVDTAEIDTLTRRCHSLIDRAAHAGQDALLLHIVKLLEKHL